MAKVICLECNAATLCPGCQAEAEREYYQELHTLEAAAENAWLFAAESAGETVAEAERLEGLVGPLPF